MNQGNPLFSIIAVLYKKEKQVSFFIDSIVRQTLKEKIELILVDDHSPDEGSRIVENYNKGHGHVPLEIVHVRNEENLGNCISRNRGIAKARGEYLIITDADCIFSPNYLEEFKKCFELKADVVVSHFGIELGKRNPQEAIKYYENNRLAVLKDRKIQESSDLSSFLNCVTRGVGIRRCLIKGELYDPQFTYSASKDSGFGWEDIDAGYQLFSRGARIVFANESFSLHVTHPSSIEERAKFIKSLRNYRKLHEKNPEIFSLKKEWSIKTYEKICSYLIKTRNYVFNDDMSFLSKHFKLSPSFYLNLILKTLTTVFKTSDKNSSKLVVYTAIFGNRDRLMRPTAFKNVDYICFTDNPSLKSDIWKIVYVKEGEDPRRLAKIYKILPHKFLPNYQYSLWVDGTHVPIQNPWIMVKKFLKHKDIALFSHFKRNCIYEEAKACIELNKDDSQVIIDQVTKYLREGFPRHAGLATCTVILRRHHQRAILSAMEDWWKEIVNHSVRDQLSFNYIMQKNQLEYEIIPGNVYKNKYFQFQHHIGEEPKPSLNRKMINARKFFVGVYYSMRNIYSAYRCKIAFIFISLVYIVSLNLFLKFFASGQERMVFLIFGGMNICIMGLTYLLLGREVNDHVWRLNNDINWLKSQRRWLLRFVLGGGEQLREKYTKEDVTVIIGVNDKADYRLVNVLKSLRNQDYDQDLINILITDYQSSEEIVAILKEVCKKYNAQYIHVDGFLPWSKSRCINSGIHQVSTKYILIADADTVFESNYIKEAVKPLINDPYQLIYCPWRFTKKGSITEATDIINEYQSIKKIFDDDSYGSKDFSNRHPGTYFLLTEFLHKINGLDEFYSMWSRVGDDLIKRLGMAGLKLNNIEQKTSNLYQCHPKGQDIRKPSFRQVQNDQFYYNLANTIRRNDVLENNA